MKFVTRKVHGVLDYLVSLILVTAPFIDGMSKDSTLLYVPVVLGTFTIIISVFTNYEGGIVRVIPFRLHLAADTFQALLLGLSPWIFGVSGKMVVPVIVVAVLELGVVLCTEGGEQRRNESDMSIERLNRLRQKWVK